MKNKHIYESKLTILVINLSVYVTGKMSDCGNSNTTHQGNNDST